jgi:hypothetical protein
MGVKEGPVLSCLDRTDCTWKRNAKFKNKPLPLQLGLPRRRKIWATKTWNIKTCTCSRCISKSIQRHLRFIPVSQPKRSVYTTNACLLFFLTGISTPPNPLANVTPRRLCSDGSGLAQIWPKSAQVCSPIHKKPLTFNERPENATFPSPGSQICSHLTLNPRQLSWSACLHPRNPFLHLKVTLSHPLHFT